MRYKILYILGKIFFLLSNILKKATNQYLQKKYINNFKTIGEGVKINGISTITGTSNIEMGNNVHIGDNAYIRGEGGLKIGDNTHISRNLILYTHNHNYEGKRLPYDDTSKFRPVVIEKNVWVGMNVTILPGTHIKEGVIIGAGSVIGGKTEKYSIYGAQLASKINERDIDNYIRLDENKMYGGINGRPIK